MFLVTHIGHIVFIILKHIKQISAFGSSYKELSVVSVLQEDTKGLEGSSAKESLQQI